MTPYPPVTWEPYHGMHPTTLKITPEIMGPGIEEEYADAMAAITDLREALGERPLTNNTPDGRLLLELAWLEQEIKAQRLPIPVDRSRVGTTCYLVGSGELDHIPGVEAALARLSRVVKGIGLIKPRHTPVVIAVIEWLLADAQAVWGQLSPEQRDRFIDLRVQKEILEKGEWPSFVSEQKQFRSDDNSDRLIANISNRLFDINAALYSQWRPHAARKPPLAPPVPGLPVKAPMLPPGLEGKLP